MAICVKYIIPLKALWNEHLQKKGGGGYHLLGGLGETKATPIRSDRY